MALYLKVTYVLLLSSTGDSSSLSLRKHKDRHPGILKPIKSNISSGCSLLKVSNQDISLVRCKTTPRWYSYTIRMLASKSANGTVKKPSFFGVTPVTLPAESTQLLGCPWGEGHGMVLPPMTGCKRFTSGGLPQTGCSVAASLPSNLASNLASSQAYAVSSITSRRFNCTMLSNDIFRTVKKM
ncbi:hypothetical protein PHYBLDRAFT_171481 [Phycomyces blakesleeanus NRRL 1555(-)]|uniref:Uncharacterized protein n=1 Tax=Phycomyces blakesleeanus (strain ATCC 8743b / DSM 1359 / FGSC 10004 / NBRC 33097 / NRRL 1555) TaxID=763407 RepID=A0A162ZZS7_PHYB8|nr:hypothetical protein PHYBLDRAFT_171481 [Phycomyces blakesleeanus NRRL 1555(-)]OAD70091.1 hypothetical protein PHYBLDRAFT_171481 [Phycomyces blakesleeanus NRRL 1555(-)]|eukprot:XP_018288131.1 hypothetical protein PHYBLDRAFT_171481 [Phycomyces blakesleeanus NRRL 1555(-)]